MSNVKFYMGDDDTTPLNFSNNQKFNSNSKNLIQNQPQDTRIPIKLRKRPLRDNRKENNCYEIFQNLFKVFIAYLTIYIYG